MIAQILRALTEFFEALERAVGPEWALFIVVSLVSVAFGWRWYQDKLRRDIHERRIKELKESYKEHINALEERIGKLEKHLERANRLHLAHMAPGIAIELLLDDFRNRAASTQDRVTRAELDSLVRQLERAREQAQEEEEEAIASERVR